MVPPLAVTPVEDEEVEALFKQYNTSVMSIVPIPRSLLTWYWHLL